MEYKLWENNVPEFDASIDQPEPSLTPFLVSKDKNEKSDSDLKCQEADLLSV